MREPCKRTSRGPGTFETHITFNALKQLSYFQVSIKSAYNFVSTYIQYHLDALAVE